MAKDKILGVIPEQKLTDPTPQGSATEWETDAGQVSVVEPPPPWELPGNSDLLDSDARRFLTYPDNWTVRWINPRLLDQFGWRDWQPVMASDPRITVHVETMVSPEGNIRRGGMSGDILAWMFTSWVESRRRLLQQETDRLTRSAPERQEQLKEDFRRGKYGPNIQLTEARHPRYTNADPRTMRD